MTDSEGSEQEGARVAWFVTGVFGTIAVIFGGIAAYVFATQTRPNDLLGVMLGGAWLMASAIVAIGLAALSGSIRGVTRRRSGPDSGAIVDPEALRAEAWVGASAEWEGRASVPFDAPAPTLFMLVSGIALCATGVALYMAGRILIPGMVSDALMGAFLIYWAWLAWSGRKTRA